MQLFTAAPIARNSSDSTTVGFSALISALVVTAVFSLRWINCLPFSGYSPALENIDTLGFMGRYLLFAQEPFRIPVGTIHSLSFPFESGHISRGAIPLFALIFKFFGQFFPALLEFNYMVFAELLAVFATAYFTCRLLAIISIRSVMMRFLGACFVALSPALLFRSSNYYGETFVVLSFPMFLVIGYLGIQLFASPEKWKWRLAFVAALVATALIDMYLLFGVSVLLFTAGLVAMAFYATTRNEETLNSIRTLVWSCVVGGGLSLLGLWIIGNQNNLEAPARSTVFKNRDASGWAYGGGFGGGFHVSDVFSVILSNPTSEAGSKIEPPRSLATVLGIPLVDKPLQPGQYEGFSYIGTVPLFILLLGLGGWLRAKAKAGEWFRWGALRLNLVFFLLPPRHLAIVSVGLACVCLYMLSWGYVLHLFGHRLDNVITPSTILAFLYPTFMYARSLGRFAIPFSMLVSILALVLLYRSCMFPALSERARNVIIAAMVACLAGLHVYDVRDYLRPPSLVHQGNEIAETFSAADIALIRNASRGRVAVMIVPELLSSVEWNRIGFALAYHARIPISGATLGFGEKASEKQRYADDIQTILDGDIEKIISMYGPVMIAVPKSEVAAISARSVTPLVSVALESQDVVLLIPKRKPA